MDAPTAERVDRLAQLHEELTAAVDRLAHSDAWRRMLEVASRLPTYSPSNVLLIAVQRPDATRVAGFRAWKALGRHVVKGEKGIAILAPCLYRASDPGGGEVNRATSGEGLATAPEDAQRQLRGFRVVHVFDVAQTEGEVRTDVDPRLIAEGLESIVNAVLMISLQASVSPESRRADATRAVLDAALRPPSK